MKEQNYEFQAKNIPSKLREKTIMLYLQRVPLKEISNITKLPTATINYLLSSPFNIIFKTLISHILLGGVDINKDDCYTLYRTIYNKLKKGSIYRNHLKLIPIAIFFYLKSRSVFITTGSFMNVVNLTREQFRKGFKTIFPYCNLPIQIDNTPFIYSLINQIYEKLDLPASFSSASKAIFQKFGYLIMNTKPKITAGVICILTLLKLNIQTVKLLEICNILEFEISSALYQVKNSILKRMGVEGFQGFKKIPHLIQSLLQGMSTSQSF